MSSADEKIRDLANEASSVGLAGDLLREAKRGNVKVCVIAWKQADGTVAMAHGGPEGSWLEQIGLAEVLSEYLKER